MPPFKVPFGSAYARPFNGGPGVYFDTTLNKPIFWNGIADWNDGVAALPRIFPATPLMPQGTLGADPFSFASWSLGAATVSSKAALGPDGVTYLDQLVPTTASSGHSATGTIAKAAIRKHYIYQVWAKNFGYDLTMTVDDGTATNRVQAQFNLSTLATFPAATGTFALSVAKCVQDRNGLVRCILVVKSGPETTLRFDLRPQTYLGATVYAGDTTKSVGLWCAQIQETPTPVLGVVAPVIIASTDMKTDNDDIRDLLFLNRMADRGECTIPCVIVDGPDDAAAPCVKAFMTFSGRPNTSIGAYKGNDQPTTPTSTFNTLVRDRFRPGDGKANYPDPVPVMRQALAAAPDGSVILVVLGGLVTFRDLLMSPADAYSPLTGRQLWARKVRLLACSAGNYPSTTTPEHNFALNPAASKYVIDNCPSEIWFFGAVGGNINSTIPLGTDGTVNPYRYGWDNANSGYNVVCSGIVSTAITAVGSGGTDGTYALGISGGAVTNASGTFTVSGGKLASIQITSPGFNATSNPTLSFAACPGLTGATGTATYGNYNARPSWGSLALYAAIRGVDANIATQDVYGTVAVDATGNDVFTAGEPNLPQGKHIWLQNAPSVNAFAATLNQLCS